MVTVCSNLLYYIVGLQMNNATNFFYVFTEGTRGDQGYLNLSVRSLRPSNVLYLDTTTTPMTYDVQALKQ